MKYIAKKLLALILTLFFTAMLSFFIFTVIPGDAAVTKAGVDADEQTLEAIREKYGLNDPVGVRFVNWIKSAVSGDFGESIKYDGRTVGSLLSERLPATVGLAIMSVILILLISIPIGLLTSVKENGAADITAQVASQVTMAIPSFVQGIIVTLIFGILLRWFPVGGYVNPGTDFLKFLRFMFFPALAVALPKAAMTIRFMKSTIREQRGSDYVRTARAKGNSRRQVMFKHIFKNTLLPVITFVGLIVAEVLAGSIMIEQVFNIPGMGRLLVTSIANRDFPVVQAVVIYIASIVLVVNTAVDILYKLVDPRQNS